MTFEKAAGDSTVADSTPTESLVGRPPRRIAVIGAGYVGLTTAACFSHLGHCVTCADVVQAKVEGLQRGLIPIVEEGLRELVVDGQERGLLRFVLGASNAVEDAEFVFLCVPTPQGEDGAADMSYVQAAAAEIGPLLSPGTVVVNKSTVPVGSARVVERALGRSDVSVVSNPEFLREGSGVYDFLHPDRIIVGADSQEAAVRVGALFDGIRAPFVVTDPPTAEMIKYASNAFLATKVSFVNAIANVCEAVGANVTEVALGMGYDTRIGSRFLQPGPGWGGSCFPKDSHALVRIAQEAGYSFDLLKGVISVNEEQYERVVAKVLGFTSGSLEGVRVAVWGLTFKAGTDDLRDSPALFIIEQLAKRGASIRAFDPTVSRSLPDMEITDDAYSACDDAEVLVILTEWPQFTAVDLGQIRRRMARPKIVDGRNVLDPSAARRAGFHYVGIGLK